MSEIVTGLTEDVTSKKSQDNGLLERRQINFTRLIAARFELIKR